MSEPFVAHDLYTHGSDGRVCVLAEDGTWFVPYDAGGEGNTCERRHGMSHKAIGRAWSAYLDLLMDAHLEDGTSILALILEADPDLRDQLDTALRGTT